MPDEVTALSTKHLCNYYKRGQAVFLEGNHPMGLFCINKGRVKISQLGAEGKEQIIRHAKEGDVVGYRSLICGEPYNASAIALEESRICIIPSKVFFGLLEKNPEVTSAVMKLLAGDLKSAEMKVTQIAQKSVPERLAEALLMLREYYGEDDADTLTITREEIARYVGTATETAIRVIAEFKREGLISVEGKRIIILDRVGLVKIANLHD